MVKQAQTGKQKKAAAQAAVQAGAVNEPEAKAAKLPAVIPQVNAKAVQKDIGPRVIAALAQEDEATAQLVAIKDKNRETLSQLTLAIVNAARIDNGIDLASCFSKEKKDKEFIHDQLGLALGIREVKKTDKGTERLVYSSAVAQYFPQATDDKESDAFRRKTTFRTNWLRQLDKCTGVAVAIIEKKMKATAEDGTLRLEGPAVKSAFGQTSVLLNEQQSVGKGDSKVTLVKKPSFQAVMDVAAASHGAARRAAAGGAGAPTPIGEPDKNVIVMAQAMVKAIAALDEKHYTANVIAQLKALRDKIEATGHVSAV